MDGKFIRVGKMLGLPPGAFYRTPRVALHRVGGGKSLIEPIPSGSCWSVSCPKSFHPQATGLATRTTRAVLYKRTDTIIRAFCTVKVNKNACEQGGQGVMYNILNKMGKTGRAKAVSKVASALCSSIMREMCRPEKKGNQTTAATTVHWNRSTKAQQMGGKQQKPVVT